MVSSLIYIEVINFQANISLFHTEINLGHFG